MVGVTGAELEGSAKVGFDDAGIAEVSEAADWERDVIGAIKFWRFGSDAWGESGEMGLADSS